MMSDRLRRAVKITLFSLLPAALLLGILEIVSYLTISRRVETVRAGVGLIYRMHVGRWPWSRSTSTALNSQGFPDREFPTDVTADSCVRAVFAGDSFFFGDGVDRDSSAVSLVQGRMPASGPGCVRIFNVAERGTTIDRQKQRVLELYDQLRPHIVVLGQYQNDLTDLANPGGPLSSRPTAAGSTFVGFRRIPVPTPSLNVSFVKLLTYHTIAFSIQHGYQRDELHRWSVMADTSKADLAQRMQATYRTYFAELAAELRRRNVTLGVVVMPSKLDLLAKRFPEEKFFLSLAEEFEAPSLRIFPVLDGNREPYPFLMYDGHLNERGNRLLADTIAAWMLDSLASPFPQLRAGGPHPSPPGPTGALSR